IADVLTFERSEWGNNASPVTAEQIAALRKELASHAESFTEHDILAVPDQDLPGGPASAGGAPPKPGEAAKPGPPPKPYRQFRDKTSARNSAICFGRRFVRSTLLEASPAPIHDVH